MKITNNDISRLYAMRNGCFEALRSYDTPQAVKEAFLRAAERYTAQIIKLQNQQP
jgi:hypothetical protein